MSPEMEIGTDKRPSELIWTQASAARSIFQIELTPVQKKSAFPAFARNVVMANPNRSLLAR